MQTPPPEPSSPTPPWPARLGAWRAALPTLAVALIAVAELGGSAFLSPTRTALGGKSSEAVGHLWGLWATTKGLWRHGPLLRVADIRFPTGFKAHLMDPINLVVFAPLYALFGGGASGATFAWNALCALAPVLGAWGCWRLGRQLVPDHPAAPWGVAVMTAVFCATPGLQDFAQTGRSEMLPAVIFPLQLSFLVAWLLPRGAGVRPRYRDGMAAGLLLGAMVLGGWYLATFLLFLEIPLGLLLVRGLPLRDALGRLVRVSVVGLVCALPVLWSLHAWPAQNAAAALAHAGPLLNPQSYPASSVFSPLRVAFGRATPLATDNPPYVGLISLALCGMALFYGGARARPWLALGMWGILVAMGPFGRIGQHVGSGVQSPTAGIVELPLALLVKVFPVLSGIRRWSRIAPLVAAPIGVGAMFGFLAMAPRDPWSRRLFGAATIAAVLIDQGTFPTSVNLDRPSFDASNPALLGALETLQRGPILPLPFEIIHPDLTADQPRGLYLLWQLEHGHPVSTGMLGEADATLATSYFSQVLYNLQVQSEARANTALGMVAPALPMPAPDVLACASADAQNLRATGFVAVTLQTHLPGGDGLEDALEAMLGEPVYAHDTTYAWELSRAPQTAETQRLRRTCRAPGLRTTAAGR